jgi:DNA-binding transcriptional ArsR family regulator
MSNRSYVETNSQLGAAKAISLDTATKIAEVFAAMSDPTRVRILAVLAGSERSVRDIATLVELSESATSHQLRLLRTQRIVRARKAGRQVFYALDDDHIRDLMQRALEHIEHE